MTDRTKIKYWWSEDKKWFCILTDDGVSQSTVSLTPEEASLLSVNAALGAWQDISTAPKDGAEIIGVHISEWGDRRKTVYGPWTVAFRRGAWQSSWDGCQVVDYMSDFGTDYKTPDLEPTHWMPLPPAPATLTEQPSEAPPSAPDVREAIDREERYLIEHLDAECGIMPGDIEGSFHRIREALLSAQPAKGER